MRTDFDVVIVGAGPAGSVAARELMRRDPGLNVLLLEKEKLPRLKPCAGGIAPQAEESLRRLELWEGVEPLCCKVTAAELITLKGKSFILAGSATASVCRRDIFDEYLVRQAEAAGVTVLDGCGAEEMIFENGTVAGVRCRAEHEDAVYFAGTTLIAGGAVTKFRRRDPDKEQITTCTAWYQNARFEPGKMMMVFPKELSPHYIWLFPESEDRCNIGLCVYVKKLRGNGRNPDRVTILDLYNQMVEKYFKKTVSGAEMSAGPRVFPILPSKNIGEGAYPGTLLVGDAARTINPFTGEGISFALEGAEIAARMVIQGRKEGLDWETVNSRYAAALHNAAGPALRKGRLLCRTGPFLLNAAGFMSRFPAVKSAITKGLTKL